VAKFILAPCVEDELWIIWSFIARDNPDAADRVVEAAYETFKTLADKPSLGRSQKFGNRRLKDIRSWRVTGFDNYLIFYHAIPEGIQVLHVNKESPAFYH
jgi:plasmid stabilization system protein ParE